MCESEIDFPNNKIIINPEYYVSLINKYVDITTRYNITISGFLSAVDPLTESVILSKSINEDTSSVVVLGHSIHEINVKEAPPDVKPKAKVERAEVTINDKKVVLNWLLKNLLPVEDKDGILHIRGDQIIIQPPYRTEDCISTNPIVLGRIQHLLRCMPSDN